MKALTTLTLSLQYQTLLLFFFIALAPVLKWNLLQFNINNAFLYGYINENIYIQPPLDYTKASKG